VDTDGDLIAAALFRIDEIKKAKQMAAITEGDYSQRFQEHARDLLAERVLQVRKGANDVQSI